jgi:hypothetical protein
VGITSDASIGIKERNTPVIDQNMSMDALQAYAEEQSAMVTKVLEANPGLPVITAHIIAGDLMSAERATRQVAEGMPAEQAVNLVGSYARWDWALQMVAAGVLSEQWFQDNVCHLWSGSDPDDMKPEYLAVWQRARLRAGGVIRDGRPLPTNGNSLLRVFRGGPPFNLRGGFAWTTDPKVARRFANGAGVRTPQAGGIVISGLVRHRDVIAYITDRNESEVIVDPRRVRNVRALRKELV